MLKLTLKFKHLRRLFLLQVFLGDFPLQLFTEDAITDIIKKYQENLKILETEMEERNKNLDHAYTFLLPSRISKSIAI